jgi:hypothetical protein
MRNSDVFLFIEDNDEHRLRAQILFYDFCKIVWADEEGNSLFVPNDIDATLFNIEEYLKRKNVNGIFLDLGLSIIQFNVLQTLIDATVNELIRASSIDRTDFLKRMGQKLDDILQKWDNIFEDSGEIKELQDFLKRGEIPIGGLKILQVLRNKHPNLPMFILSDFQPGHKGERFFHLLGADGYFYKPSIMNKDNVKKIYERYLK